MRYIFKNKQPGKVLTINFPDGRGIRLSPMGEPSSLCELGVVDLDCPDVRRCLREGRASLDEKVSPGLKPEKPATKNAGDRRKGSK
jgi:hypothetical protein